MVVTCEKSTFDKSTSTILSNPENIFELLVII